VSLATAYNVKLKRTALSIVPYVGAFGLLPCFVTLGAPGAPFPPWSVPVATALLGASAHVLNVLPDVEFDRRSGATSFPLRLPPPVAWAASGVGLTGSCALLTFGGGSPSVGAVAALFACVALGVGAVLLGARRSEWGFRLACLVALADVGLLATSRR
jgi:4-hydroxybenzoate polyprenyltransferase